MGKDQDLILAVRNQDLSFLNKYLQRPNKSTSKQKHRGSAKKLNVNYQDGDGMSGLHQAALMGHTEIMEILLQNGASVNLKDNKGMIALHYAAWQGKTEPVHLLLDWQSPSNEAAHGGETPLHLACQHGHFDVVNLLLLHQASPTMLNKDRKSALHLACEFGRYRVVDLLLRSNLCSQLLVDSHSDMTEHTTTCLHLAAKNGHSEIIRLLLQGGMNINRVTLQGTCLHEAALFGKTDVVKLLLDCGVDVNKVNSYDQTALDIVNKFTSNKASKEIKQLLKEASFSVQAKAVRDHCNIHEPYSLTFRDGDLIKIVEQRQDGMWRGSVLRDGCSGKPGWFPADHVVLIDNSAGKRNLLVHSHLYSTPPITPDKLSSRSSSVGSFTFNGFRTPLTSSRSSYGSIGHDEAFPPPPSPTCMTKFEHVNNHKENTDATEVISLSPEFPPPPICVTQFPEDLDEDGKELSPMPLPPPPSYQNLVNNNMQQPVNGKVIVNHVNHVGEHCYVDNIEPAYQNSWDMHASSPGGSNRNSAASSDSGRGLSTNYLDPKGHHNYVNVHVNNQYRLSGTSYESGVSSRQSYHSTSSSSVGSLDRLEESGYSSQINVAELFQAGVPDHEVLRAWLRDLNYEEYYQNFVGAGYDMPTITHMTPQDLTAIGISKPGHRKKLKTEIARLNIHDGIPDFKPNDLYDWLRMLNLEQYYNTLANQGYDNIDYVIDITWEDLEEIGIQRLGHQKKIMLAIDRLKRILSGSKRLSTVDGRDAGEVLEPPMACVRWSGERSSPPPPAPPQYNELPAYLKPRRSSSGDSLSTNSSGEMKSMNQHLESEYANTNSMQPKPPSVVPILVKRSMSQSAPNGISDTDPVTGQKMCQSFHAPPDRTSDYSDRESTPTGDSIEHMSRSPVTSSAQVAPLVAAKPKPVAMIIAKAKQSSREGSPDIIDVEKHEAERNMDGYKSPVKNLEGFKYPLASNGSLKRRTGEHIYDIPQLGPPRTVSNYVNYPTMSVQPNPSSPLHVSTGFNYSQQAGSPQSSQQNSPGARNKKAPPPPPKRTASIKSMEIAHGNRNSGPSLSLSTASTTSPRTSVLSPPPIQQKPQVAQAQAFVNCVQSLSERFGKMSEESGSGDGVSSDSEELPPAPPVAMEIIEPKISNYGLLGKNDKATSGEYMLQQRLKRESSSSASPGNNSVESAFGVKLRQASQMQTLANEISIKQQSTTSTPSNIHLPEPIVASANTQNAQERVQNTDSVSKDSANGTKDVNKPNGTDKHRKDSTSSGELSSSTSSLDSNTLPFANENVGTIKQRAQQVKPSLVMFMEDGAQPPEDTQGGDVFADNTDTMRRVPNKLPKPQQPAVQHLQQQQTVPAKPQSPQTQNQTLKSQPQQQQQQQQNCIGVQRPQQQQQQQQQQYNASVTASYAPSAQAVSQGQGSTQQSPTKKPGPKPAVSPKPQPKGQAAQGGANGKRSGDVLSEIDNMLQGLTDELDAMLEFELTE
ncbi:caskin-2-like isoform X3 [Dreissena polymorpha]|uniref:caskin-2-like isoform X3 n=1 Tax=Dreissena polymorpha TaxID=45954 RepID=UPI002264AA93|nr:caskin-2-like isoform X3 [Dreissena polymorpha]